MKIITNLKSGNYPKFAGTGSRNLAPFAQPYDKNLKPVVKVPKDK